jgi:hypothetical protein
MLLHVPQLSGSVAVTVQIPLHDVSPVAQPLDVPQMPAVHVSPLAHTIPHVPQFAGSVAVSVQPAVHIVSGAVHVVVPPWHVPLVHVPLQTAPQDPQLAALLVVSTQTPEHSVVPMAQPPVPVSRATPVSPMMTTPPPSGNMM